ncbi:MAG: hypothetical protein PVF58_08815 [Candidatus Methanofastidiosia archaeon]
MKCPICGSPGYCEHKRMMRNYVTPVVVIVIVIIVLAAIFLV